MVSFPRHASFYDGYAFRVGACDYSRRQHSVRDYELHFAMEATMVLAIRAGVSRCWRHVPQRVVEGFVRQSKARMGRSVDGTRGPQFSQRTHNDGNDYLWLHGYLSDPKNRVLAVAISYSDHNDLARFPGRAKQDVSGGALLKRCFGGDGGRNILARALPYHGGNIASPPRLIIVRWPEMS